MAWYDDSRPYVSASERRQRAAREMAKRTKRGLAVEPVAIDGRTIARTFWGKAWNEHLERYCDLENRLPRGRTYVRNGSVLHLAIEACRIEALVQGSRATPYKVEVSIAGLPRASWKEMVGACAGEIDSLVELLQGKLSNGVMRVVTDPHRGLFPSAAQIEMKCSCPDWATMCKHVAAVLYGIGARLDTKPELLFVLRGVDHLELLDTRSPVTAPSHGGARKRLDDEELGSVFGIEIDVGAGTGAGPGRTSPSGTGAPKARGGGAKASAIDATRTRRSSAAIGETLDTIVALLRRHPSGLRAEQIRAELQVPATALPRPIAEGLAAKRIRKTGHKRSTTYHAGR
jgi:uncharacterized Zn finger protein